LNREEKQLVACPYLEDAVSYVPDLVDLTKDEAARDYWLSCFERTINTVRTYKQKISWTVLKNILKIISLIIKKSMKNSA
jgi:hypothetical protein